MNEVEIAVVGGGPAGAATAARLAAAGREVAVFERWPEPRWRASGVYSSPATRSALLDLGLSPAGVAALVRPISELRVMSVTGASCRFLHGMAGPAVGVDRVRLEASLLDHARRSGALVLEGALVRSISRRDDAAADAVELQVSTRVGTARWRARLVVGADGPRSLVARSVGAAAPRLGRVPWHARAPILRAGVTLHRGDPRALPPSEPMPARLVFGHGWYCGVTPVPRGRVNIGIVLTPRELDRRLAGSAGARAVTSVVEGVLHEVPADERQEPEEWRAAPITDAVRVAMPLAHRVRRVAGDRFLLVGDAAGFVDPVSGEGIHRALLSAELAADAIEHWRDAGASALGHYDAQLREQYARKDVISWLLQAFMSRPAVLDYAVRRLERRESVRRVLGLVMSDLAPPERALHPRFLAALLAP